jgi:hypothetical protein
VRNDLNIKIEKVPEHYVLSSDAMDEIVSLLFVLAYMRSWDVSSDDQNRAKRIIKAIEGGGEDGNV